MNQATPYERLGGEPMLRQLVERFYDLMDTDPDAYAIRKLHPADLGGSRQKLFEFLSGWLGGPDLYIEKHGHARLRARHLPFPIGAPERDAWMHCMDQAMRDVVNDDALRQELHDAFYRTADFMRNQAEIGETNILRIQP